MSIGFNRFIKFETGAGFIYIEATEKVFGVYDRYKIYDCILNGDMYSSVSDFVSYAYDENGPLSPDEKGHMIPSDNSRYWYLDDATWGQFIGSTLDFNLKPQVKQDKINIEGVISVPDHFLDGLWYAGVGSLSSLKSIGAYAFAGGTGTINVTDLPYHTANEMNGIDLPSVTHIGYGAFAYCNKLAYISLNRFYTIERYINSTEILYVNHGEGTNIYVNPEDNKEYFITHTDENNESLTKQYFLACNRYLEPNEKYYKLNIHGEHGSGYTYIFDRDSTSRTGEYDSNYYTLNVCLSRIPAEQRGRKGVIQLVDVNSPAASSIRICVDNNGTIKALARYHIFE